MSRHLDLIGIGPGNPDWLTLAAVDAIQHLDVLFVVIKEHDVDDLVEFRRQVLPAAPLEDRRELQGSCRPVASPATRSVDPCRC